jgi:hypothetical protein
MHTAMRGFVLLAALVALVGCKVVERQPKGRSPLLPLAGSGEMVTLEIFAAPTPLGDPQLESLWSQVDEQSLAPEVRRKLSQNGLRAGLIGPHLPSVLADLLKVTGEPLSAEERSLVPMEAEPGTTLRVLQLLPGKRYDQVVTPTFEQISLLRQSDGQPIGKTYQKAEGRLVLHVLQEPDARVRLDVQFELQHGEVKAHVTGSEGMFIWKPERSKQVFDDLQLSVKLGPGQMFLITCQSDRPGSIGHHFFAQQDGEKPMQKLWVLRAAQAGADRAFLELPAADGEPLSSDMPQ